MTTLSDRDRGIVAGLLITSGSFGGDGRQPHVMLRMHVRHEPLLRWLAERFARTKLYGPYNHGGREYFQWVARGPGLIEDVLPCLDSIIGDGLDPHTADRVAEMRAKYPQAFAPHPQRRSPAA